MSASCHLGCRWLGTFDRRLDQRVQHRSIRNNFAVSLHLHSGVRVLRNYSLLLVSLQIVEGLGFGGAPVVGPHQVRIIVFFFVAFAAHL